MAGYYDESRVAKLKEIIPRFVSHARVGDNIEFGLRGDPYWPAEFDSTRPKGQIVRVKGVGTDHATIRVKTDKGAMVDIPAHNIDPRRVWEFDTPTFNRVLQRTQPVSENASNAGGSNYRGSSINDGFADLRAKVDQLANRLDQEMKDNRSFNGALISSFNELAGEVSRSSPGDTPFSNTFTNEYRAMMDNGNVTAKGAPSPFESDFTDSDFE